MSNVFKIGTGFRRLNPRMVLRKVTNTLFRGLKLVFKGHTQRVNLNVLQLDRKHWLEGLRGLGAGF